MMHCRVIDMEVVIPQKRPRGRPPIPRDELKSRSIKVGMTEAERAILKATADARGLTLAGTIRRAIHLLHKTGKGRNA